MEGVVVSLFIQQHGYLEVVVQHKCLLLGLLGEMTQTNTAPRVLQLADLPCECWNLGPPVLTANFHFTGAFAMIVILQCLNKPPFFVCGWSHPLSPPTRCYSSLSNNFWLQKFREFIMSHFGTDHLICLTAKGEDISQLPCTAALYVILFRAPLYSI